MTILKVFLMSLLTLPFVAQGQEIAKGHTIGIQGTRFTLDGKPFSYTGVSFFNAIYNPTFNESPEARRKWIKKFQSYGINVLRVWCQWDSVRGFVDTSPDATMYNPDGTLRPTKLAVLKDILADADGLGMCVEVVLFSQESFEDKRRIEPPGDERAVTAMTQELKPYRNATFQIWNEHTDGRMLHLVGVIKSIDPARLVSNCPDGAGNAGPDVENKALDYLTPHTKRGGRHWDTVVEEVTLLLQKFGKPVVDDEPARNGTSQFGGPQNATSPFDHIVHMLNVRRAGGYPTYHHDMFQTGYGTPPISPTGIPDPEHNPYHRVVFDYLARHDRYDPADAGGK